MTKPFLAVICGIFIVSLMSSCSKPFEDLYNKKWVGYLYRTADDQKLSEVAFQMKHDTLFIYSNAVFGSGNDTLLLESSNKADSLFHYVSKSGNTYNLKASFSYEKKDTFLFLHSNDFLIAAYEDKRGSIKLPVPDWYWNCSLPRETFMYLSGTYEGSLEMNRQWDNLELMGIGGIRIKLDFLDHFKVRMHVKSLALEMLAAIGGNSKHLITTVDYRIEGNKLHLDPKDKNAITIEVMDHGQKLVYFEESMTIELHKQR